MNGLERQLADVLRQSEENGHRVTVMEAELARLRSDQEQRLGALERAAAAAQAALPQVGATDSTAIQRLPDRP